MNKSGITKLLKKCVNLLVEGRFSELVESGMGGRLSEEELRQALEDYPGEITMPNDIAFESFHLYAVHEGGWVNVEFDLWYDGRPSDLTLSARFRSTHVGEEFEIMDVHVL